MKMPRSKTTLCLFTIAFVCLPGIALADYIKNPENTTPGTTPPDVDKAYPNLTCWIATAANMLAGADYGHGYGQSDVQDRAQEIYDVLVDEFGDST